MMQVVALVRHVELVGHHLTERRAGALAQIRLADVERRGVVLVNDDPRIKLAEIDVGIWCRLCARVRNEPRERSG